MSFHAVLLNVVFNQQIVLLNQILWALHQPVLKHLSASTLHFPEYLRTTVRQLDLLAENLPEVAQTVTLAVMCWNFDLFLVKLKICSTHI